MKENGNWILHSTRLFGVKSTAKTAHRRFKFIVQFSVYRFLPQECGFLTHFTLHVFSWDSHGFAFLAERNVDPILYQEIRLGTGLLTPAQHRQPAVDWENPRQNRH